MQVGFYRGHRALEHLRDLLERMAEHIHQDDAAALGHRQAHQGAQAGGRGLAALDRAVGIGDRLQRLVAVLDALAAGAAAQEIQRRVVGDAEQPALDVGERAGMREGLDRLDQRLLQHVLAVDHRARHAGAIAVQPRPQLGQQPLELCLRVGHACLLCQDDVREGPKDSRECDFFRESFATGQASPQDSNILRRQHHEMDPGTLSRQARTGG